MSFVILHLQVIFAGYNATEGWAPSTYMEKLPARYIKNIIENIIMIMILLRYRTLDRP